MRARGRKSKLTQHKQTIIMLANDGLTISQIAESIGVTAQTVINWKNKDRELKDALDNLSADHHLKKQKGRPYVMRVTIDAGKGKVGKRINIALSTYNIEEARQRRDVQLAFLNKTGVKLLGKVPSHVRLIAQK